MSESAQRELIDPQVIAQLGNLPLHSRTPMLGNVSGKHRSPHRGSSVEFAEYRKYVPGDDTRRLDWRAYARSDRYYIKEFEADTNLRMCLVLDSSGSMRFAVEGVSKLDYAKRLLATLAYMAIRQGDAVGLTCAAQNLGKEIPPRRNPAHLRTLLETLVEVEGRGETGLVEALHTVAEKTPQRALVIVVSDLFVDPAALGKCFQHLRFRKHDVAVFHLLDQLEVDFDFSRPTRFVDLEGGMALLTDPAEIRKQYHRALSDYLEGLRTVCRDAQVDYHQASLQLAYGELLARFLLKRIPKRARR